MTSIFTAVSDFFKDDEWPVQQVGDDETALLTQFQGDNGRWSCLARAKEEERQFLFYSICPVNIPASKRLGVAEFITRANYGLPLGNFEMDFEDGEVRFKTSVDVEGQELTAALLKSLVYANVTLMDLYLPGLLKAIYSDTPPAEIIAQIEEN